MFLSLFGFEADPFWDLCVLSCLVRTHIEMSMRYSSHSAFR